MNLNSVLGVFLLDPDSGIVYPSQNLIGNTTHHLKVQAMDRAGEGPHSDTALIDITVYSVNQHPPVWVVPDDEQPVIDIPEVTQPFSLYVYVYM